MREDVVGGSHADDLRVTLRTVRPATMRIPFAGPPGLTIDDLANGSANGDLGQPLPP